MPGMKFQCGVFRPAPETAAGFFMYPSWMTGRIGLDPPQGWRELAGFRCISAPNRYRSKWREHNSTQQDIIAMQREEFSELAEPMGMDVDPATWDLVLLWKGKGK